MVRGHSLHMNSYRAEATGMLTLTVIFNLIQKLLPTTTTPITIYSDGKSVIQKIYSRVSSSTRHSLEDDVDIILEIQERIQDTKISFKHVLGHQDKDIAFEDLPFQSRLNVIMDENARTFLHSTPEITKPPPFYRGQRAAVFFGHKACVNNIENSLMDKFFEKNWTLHMRKTLKLNQEILKEIDWETLTSFYKKHSKKNAHTLKLHMIKLLPSKSEINGKKKISNALCATNSMNHCLTSYAVHTQFWKVLVNKNC